MLDAAPGLGGQNTHTNLFGKLALEGVDHTLARLDFPAGEFPVARVRLALRALTHQHIAIRSHQDADCDIDRCGHRV